MCSMSTMTHTKPNRRRQRRTARYPVFPMPAVQRLITETASITWMPLPISYWGSRVGNLQVRNTAELRCLIDLGPALMRVDRSRRRGRIRRCGGTVGEHGERCGYDRPGHDGGVPFGKPNQPSANSGPARANLLTSVPSVQRCGISWIRHPRRELRWAASRPTWWSSSFATTPSAISQKHRTSTSRSGIWHLSTFAVASMRTQHAPSRSVLYAFCDDA